MKLTEFIKKLEELRDSFDKDKVDDIDVFAFSEKSFATSEVVSVRTFTGALFVELRLVEDDDE